MRGTRRRGRRPHAGPSERAASSEAAATSLPFVIDEVVEPAVVNERDGHRAMLRLDLTGEHGLTQRDGHERLEVEVDCRV